MDFGTPYRVTSNHSDPAVLVICEHASNDVPAAMNRLGLSEALAQSHIAWDPGALGVAQEIALSFPSILFEGTLSRLVYDCNRPPEAASAVPERSEAFEIPGNRGLSLAARGARVAGVYEPFAKALADQIAAHRDTLDLLVTVHSFTPVFHGVAREVEIGILHGQDDAFARHMMAQKPADDAFDIRLNAPYAASDGVTHTLDLHGAANGLPSVMIEIRNDLIATPDQQGAMGRYLADWITATRQNRQGEGA